MLIKLYKSKVSSKFSRSSSVTYPPHVATLVTCRTRCRRLSSTANLKPHETIQCFFHIVIQYHFQAGFEIIIIDNNHDKFTLIINYLGIYKIGWNNEVLPLTISRYVFVTEAGPNVSNINLKKIINQVVFPKIFLVFLSFSPCLQSLFVIFSQKETNALINCQIHIG